MSTVFETRTAHAVKEHDVWVGAYDFWHNGRWYEAPIALAEYSAPREQAVDILNSPDYIAVARLAFLREVKLATKH